MTIDLIEAVEQFVQLQERMQSKLRAAATSVSVFKEVPVGVDMLSHDSFDPKMKNVIYYFEIEYGEPELICESISRLKKDKKVKFKLPKVNRGFALNEHANNRILYVGKSSGSFRNRLLQHLGGESDLTYALHIKRWQEDEVLKDVKLKLWYMSVDLSAYELNNRKEEMELLELLESALHTRLRPILGRSGH